ncbi:piggyBac transposable element-derived protein 4-like [Macrobrachium rosenbergii]|uniref:piggyBac transposable element-derived protein 4-like n=1 Tax=Macrobrachium rosenbergii TaxID=79674 RepID=UPI0034D3AE06
MSEDRFSFLVSSLRFDDRDTREERRQTDNFAVIRKIWDIFIVNCSKMCVPHENLTVNEQLLAFHGNCPFRMYIHSKPGKYGMKLVLVNVNSNKYMLGGIPYLGKQGTRPWAGVALGHQLAKDLTTPSHHTNRNVTTDIWFTSVPLATDLLMNCSMTHVGTVRVNKTEIPWEMKDTTNQRPG